MAELRTVIFDALVHMALSMALPHAHKHGIDTRHYSNWHTLLLNVLSYNRSMITSINPQRQQTLLALVTCTHVLCVQTLCFHEWYLCLSLVLVVGSVRKDVTSASFVICAGGLCDDILTTDACTVSCLQNLWTTDYVRKTRGLNQDTSKMCTTVLTMNEKHRVSLCGTVHAFQI